MNMRKLVIASLAALVLAAPALAQKPDAQRTIELKDGTTLYIYRDGKMAMENRVGQPVPMREGVRMETKTGEVLIMKGNEIWRLYDPMRPGA